MNTDDIKLAIKELLKEGSLKIFAVPYQDMAAEVGIETYVVIDGEVITSMSIDSFEDRDGIDRIIKN